MSSWRILLTDGLEGAGKEILSLKAEISDRKGISAEELLSEIGDYQAVIVRGRTKITDRVIEHAKALKVIGRCGVGVDNIDLKAAQENNITVVNAPVATSTSVAELTMGLIFSLAREIPRADACMKKGEWIKKELVGVELNKKSLGIIGYGRIGVIVGKLAASAGMRINAFDCFLKPESTFVDGGELLPFDDVIMNSDFISIHTPLTKDTKNLINSDVISRMKDGVFIICAARGGIIDEAALLNGLNSGKIGGAALDVYLEEPPTNRELIDHPKVIVTPHIGGQTVDAQTQASIDIASEVLAALRGDKLSWKIV
ncbi:MAG: hydroxyacid dehydrogenase [Pelolinea sp.]|nr:hydroxyacid dehydrogenase [Pelolinea sp.]